MHSNQPHRSISLDCSIISLIDAAFEGIGLVEPASLTFVYANPTLARWLKLAGTSRVRVAEVFDVWPSAAAGEALDLSSLADSPGKSYSACISVPGQPPTRVALRVCRLNWEGQPLFCLLVSDLGRCASPDISTALRRDPLTGLYDRAFLLARLAALLGGERSADHQFAVLFVDLDDFKRVNDAFGHLAGDNVLREVAHRLAGCVRDHDHVVRFGGDEFVVLAEQIASSSDIQPIINRIHDVLATPIALPHGEVALTVSIGVAEASADHRSPEDLLAAADRAMYASKR